MPGFNAAQTVLIHQQERRVAQAILDQGPTCRRGNISAPEKQRHD
jgi:hypothetical protein